MSTPEFTELNPAERKRVYTYPEGDKVTIFCVTRLSVGKSGTHRLETSDGKKFIIAPGWRTIELDVDGWTL